MLANVHYLGNRLTDGGEVSLTQVAYKIPGTHFFQQLSRRQGHGAVDYIKPPWPESANELQRPSVRRLWAKLVPNFADRGCHVFSVTDPYGRILGF
jgi:hypothetical protein